MSSCWAQALPAARLKEAVVASMRIVDMAGDFGGTWYWNRYPGAQGDVESYRYLPLLEETRFIPRDRYSYGPEIFEHCRRIGRHFGLYEHALFQTVVLSMRWDEKIGRWRLATNRSDELRARHLVMGPYPLVNPKYLSVPGLETFTGHNWTPRKTRGVRCREVIHCLCATAEAVMAGQCPRWREAPDAGQFR